MSVNVSVRLDDRLADAWDLLGLDDQGYSGDFERVARQLAQFGPRGTCLLAEFLAAHAQAGEALTLLRAVALAGGNGENQFSFISNGKL